MLFRSLFALGLILLPVIFLPSLNYGTKLDNRPIKEIEKEELKKETYNLLTDEELNKLNEIDSPPKVDNVFKRIIKLVEFQIGSGLSLSNRVLIFFLMIHVSINGIKINLTTRAKPPKK